MRRGPPSSSGTCSVAGGDAAPAGRRTLADPFALSWGETALRLVGGALFGGVVGAERERKGHDAGIRTYMLLGLGAALFGVLSVGAFSAFAAQRATTDVSFDPSRIASYVAAGVGFLGAGAIFREGDRVRGLTTAASIWAVSAVGLAAGLGFWPGAVIASALAVVTLLAEAPLRAAVRRRGGDGRREP